MTQGGQHQIHSTLEGALVGLTVRLKDGIDWYTWSSEMHTWSSDWKRVIVVIIIRLVPERQ